MEAKAALDQSTTPPSYRFALTIPHSGCNKWDVLINGIKNFDVEKVVVTPLEMFQPIRLDAELHPQLWMQIDDDETSYIYSFVSVAEVNETVSQNLRRFITWVQSL